MSRQQGTRAVTARDINAVVKGACHFCDEYLYSSTRMPYQ